MRCTHCSNYKAWGLSGNYKARGGSGNFEAWGASGGKYEARMVIFCILAAENRFSQISRKRKAVEENRKAIEENWEAVEEIRKPLKKTESR